MVFNRAWSRKTSQPTEKEEPACTPGYESALGAVVALVTLLRISAVAQGAAVGPGPGAPIECDVVATPTDLDRGEQVRVCIRYKRGQKLPAQALVDGANGQIHYEFDQLNAQASTIPPAAVVGIRASG